MPEKEAYFRVPQTDWYLNLEIDYAYRHYGHLEDGGILAAIKEESADIFLLNIQWIGAEAFWFFMGFLWPYIRRQSRFWNDAEIFEDFGNEQIDDGALFAFALLPAILKARIDGGYSCLDQYRRHVEVLCCEAEAIIEKSHPDLLDADSIEGYRKLGQYLKT